MGTVLLPCGCCGACGTCLCDGHCPPQQLYAHFSDLTGCAVGCQPATVAMTWLGIGSWWLGQIAECCASGGGESGTIAFTLRCTGVTDVGCSRFQLSTGGAFVPPDSCTCSPFVLNFGTIHYFCGSPPVECGTATLIITD